MTKQSVLVSSLKPGVGVAIALEPSDQSLFLPLLAQDRGRYPNLSYKRKLLKTEIGQVSPGPKVNAWLDSMRASSPTRVRSKASLHDTQEQSSWITQHPSALTMFEQIINASKKKQIIMFMDYDGTLSPIVADPDRAVMSNEMREAVKETAKHFPTAIVTGRCRDKVYSFVRLEELYYAGSHGMDIKGPSKNCKDNKGDNKEVQFQAASDYLPLIDEVYKSLLEKTKSIPGAKVETNKFCLSVHYRCVDEKKWPVLADQVKTVLKDYPKLKLTYGRKVLEIRPTIKWDKGKAIEFLLQSLGYANSNDVFPIYIGDDRTDEDAFKVLRHRGQGAGILVSKIPKETSASYSLQEPSEVMSFLWHLVKWQEKSVPAKEETAKRKDENVNPSHQLEHYQF